MYIQYLKNAFQIFEMIFILQTFDNKYPWKNIFFRDEDELKILKRESSVQMLIFQYII